MKTIELEDLVTLVCSDFLTYMPSIVKTKDYSYTDSRQARPILDRLGKAFLKKGWKERRRVCSRLIDIMECNANGEQCRM